MGEENKVRDVVDAFAGVANAVPVYQDVVQPAAQELGKALQTVVKTVHIALAPVSALVWGYEQIKDFVSTRVAERLKHIPSENIITPKLNVAGPALESLRYTGHEPSLSDMYANLIAAAMDRDTANGAHPAFVEIIKQLTPDEAKIVGLFSQVIPFPLVDVWWEYRNPTDDLSGGAIVLAKFSSIGNIAQCEFPQLTPTYVDNLCRLGLAEVPDYFYYTSKGVYDELENNPVILNTKISIEDNPERIAKVVRRGLRITEMGKQFTRICISR